MPGMPPRVTRHLTPKAFLGVARPLLSEREAEYGLMLAIGSAWARRGEFPSGSQVYLSLPHAAGGSCNIRPTIGW